MDDKLYLHLFEGYGVELEYMIAAKDSLELLSIADTLLYNDLGQPQSDKFFTKTAWSNELVLHVIELKTNGPCRDLTECLPEFQNDIKKINQLLQEKNAQLLPTGAHPWMNPDTDTKLWPHDNDIIYQTYHKIFNCRGHGWSNLQSTHLNLPFANDEEFSKLHTAIRLLLPIMPALSASTPILDCKPTGFVDTRLDYYRKNQAAIPSITGLVIPEQVYSESEYEEVILKNIYKDIRPYDPNNILQYEWLNSRGAIARFDRNTIEIRILDIQECPYADLAILAAIVKSLKMLVNENWLKFEEQAKWQESALSEIFAEVIKNGTSAVITNQDYLQAFNYTAKHWCSAKDLWEHILTEAFFKDEKYSIFFKSIRNILDHGNLSERILKSLDGDYSKQNLKQVYQRLAACLEEGVIFNV